MASTVKVPLLGQQRKGVVIALGVGGLGIAAYLIHRHRQQAQQAAMASAQNADAYGYGQTGYGASYGYGTVSGSPGGSYGYGTGGGWYPPGFYGYGNSNPPAEDTDTDTDNDPDKPAHRKTVTKITVPQVTGDRAKVARQTLRHAGLHYNISDRAVGVVKHQNPPGGTPVTQGSTVQLTL